MKIRGISVEESVEMSIFKFLIIINLFENSTFYETMGARATFLHYGDSEFPLLIYIMERRLLSNFTEIFHLKQYKL